MKHFLIDLDNMVILKAADGDGCIKRLEYWADILIPKREFYICGYTKRELARWELKEVNQLYENTTGNVQASTDYVRALELLYFAFSEFEVDDTDLMGLVRKLGHKLEDIDPKPQKEKHSRSSGSSGEVKRPKEGTMTERVWQVADWLYDEQDPKDSHCKKLRDSVIETCVNNEINSSTAATQFAKWKRHLNQG